MRDLVLRNLTITQAYHELSKAVSRDLPGEVNWCAFATWASRQAGQTIRQEDLDDAIRDRLGESSDTAEVLTQILDGLGRWSRGLTADKVIAELAPAAKLDRSSAAVGKGNLKVFAEIGREFARYLLGPGQDQERDDDSIDRFCEGLRKGDPPWGQSQLRKAFTALYRGKFESDPKRRAEYVLAANLRIGYHEQARLQPEVFAALNAAVADVAAVRRQVLGVAFEGRGSAISWFGRLYLRLTAPLDRLWIRLTNRLRRVARAALTDSLMTLRLPTNTLRLGSDLERDPPEVLDSLSDGELELFASRIGALSPARGSGVQDWANLDERLRYIGSFFRAYQRETRLFEAPFTEEQVDSIRQGSVPASSL